MHFAGCVEIDKERFSIVPARKPTIYVIAGCNGAGKTTFAKEFLPNEVHCLRFFNADEVARGLSPLEPSAGAVRAARLLLQEIEASLLKKQTFALETTLSGKTYIQVFLRALRLGYEIELHYLWLSSPLQAVARVRQRVRMGGHNVPERDIRRRFRRSLDNLFGHYLPLATRWSVWDNRAPSAKQLAFSGTHDIKTLRQMIAE
jgi:predicted ABC-type ATPase